MAGLAECGEVAGRSVGGILIRRAAGQHSVRTSGPCRTLEAGPEGESQVQGGEIVRRVQEAPWHRPAPPAAPEATILVPPEPASPGDGLSVQVPDGRLVGPAAALAAPTGALEPDRVRQKRPVDRVEPPLGMSDGHRQELA